MGALRDIQKTAAKETNLSPADQICDTSYIHLSSSGSTTSTGHGWGRVIVVCDFPRSITLVSIYQ